MNGKIINRHELNNNSQFVETIISLANLSYKIDRVFYDSVIDMLSTSQLYSIKKYNLHILIKAE